jgi:hypothetical protein
MSATERPVAPILHQTRLHTPATFSSVDVVIA